MSAANLPSIRNVRRIVEVAEFVETLHAKLVSLVVGTASPKAAGRKAKS